VYETQVFDKAESMRKELAEANKAFPATVKRSKASSPAAVCTGLRQPHTPVMLKLMGGGVCWLGP